jgi:hypothetical protein
MNDNTTGNKMKSAVCTIVSKNYIAYARTFAESYLTHNPGGEVYVLLVDRLDGYFDPAKERFKLIELEDIGIEGLNELLFKYSVIELNTAVKPFFMEYLFKTRGLDKLIYFDPDIMILGGIGELWDLLDTHSILLTPHLDAPLPDDLRPNEYDILLSGAYNLGFIATKNTGNVSEFLRWWQKKLRKYCYVDHYKGYFVDQKWMDLVPGMFREVHILMDPGYNTAYWNLHSRKVAPADGGYTVNGRPARFFHFSGFSPDNIESISKLQNRYTLKDREELRPLFEWYRELVLKNGYEEARGWPYAFASFDNGTAIPDVVRKAYGYMPDEDRARFGDPFKAGDDGSFFGWLGEKVGEHGGHGVTRLWHEIYKSRADLQAMFPDIFSDDWAGFIQWCLAASEAELNMPDVFRPGEAEEYASRQVIELGAEVHEKARIIEEKSRTIEAQARTIEERLAVIEAQSGIIEDKSRVIEGLALDIKSKEDTINTLLGSLSWRITRPVRWFSRLAKGLARHGS